MTLSSLQWDILDKQGVILDNSFDSIFTKALIYRIKDDTNQACALLNSISGDMMQGCNNALRHRLLGSLWLDRQEYDVALMDFKIAVELAPNEAWNHIELGCMVFYVELYQHDDEALDNFERAISIDPNHPAAYASSGFLRDDFLGEYLDALNDFNKAITLEPRSASLYADRASVHYSLQNYLNAINDYTAAINLEPNFYKDYSGIGEIGLGSHLGGRSHLAEYYTGRGEVKYAIQDTEGALADFDQALLIKPDYMRAYSVRADILDKI
ncbi:hypothetical protein GCM10027422_15470 [Hymenobacter arcticus]